MVYLLECSLRVGNGITDDILQNFIGFLIGEVADRKYHPDAWLVDYYTVAFGASLVFCTFSFVLPFPLPRIFLSALSYYNES